jgi:hypothetical protein
VTERPPAPRSTARAVRLALYAFAAASLITALSCGASIRAVYEGDVRFEHCMSLDAYADVKPTLRRACWEEWLKFYTFGQTRDRIDYARQRQQQLSAASDFEESEPNKPSGPSAVPEPISALAPPPMILVTDGGVTDAGADDAASDADAAVEPPGAACSADCEQRWNFCRNGCKTAPCEKSCTTKYKQCMKRCF